MDLARIRDALHREPFRRFEMGLADGRRILVSRPESMAVGGHRAFVIGPDDLCSIVEISEIASPHSADEDPLPRENRRGFLDEGGSHMTIEQVKQLYNAAPFRSFIIHLADGRQLPVKHREFMALSPSGRTMVVYQADDTSNIIDLLLVTDLEIQNGERSNRRCSEA
jgi:hypothetical protein